MSFLVAGRVRAGGERPRHARPRDRLRQHVVAEPRGRPHPARARQRGDVRLDQGDPEVLPCHVERTTPIEIDKV